MQSVKIKKAVAAGSEGEVGRQSREDSQVSENEIALGVRPVLCGYTFTQARRLLSTQSNLR